MVAIFKRQTKIGPRSPAHASADIREIIDLFVLLITITEFLEVTYMVNTQIAWLADILSSMKSKGIPTVKKHSVSPKLKFDEPFH